MENRAVVNKIIPFSNVDGPGNRLAIFFQGCNIECVYCHNPETKKNCINCMGCTPNCPTKAIVNNNGKIAFNERLCVECDQCIKSCKFSSSPRTTEYTVEELYKIVDEYKLFIRGITVSGGEPTIQAEFITELFRKVKPLGLSCFVDTNGFFDKVAIQDLIEVTDKFMVDIKAVDNIKMLCGTDMTNNLDNLKYLLSIDKVHEVRSVLVLDYMDIENTVFTVANILKDYPEVSYKLIRVHDSGLSDAQKDKLKDKIPSEEYVMELSERVKNLGVKKVDIVI